MQILLNLLVPVIVFFTSVVGIVALAIGAIENPEGAVNTFLVKMIDNISPLFPSTPEELKIASLIDSAAGSLPIVGRDIIYDIFQTISVIFGLYIVIKIYKLIPFKAT